MAESYANKLKSIKKHFKDGLSQRQIEIETGIPRRTIREYLHKLPPITNLVINDLHIPFHDETACNLMLRVASSLQPNIITINGDLIDMFAISKFVKGLDMMDHGLEKDIDATRAWLSNLRKKFPETKIWYIYGNHEYRWDAYIETRAAELRKLKGMTLAEQLDLEKLNIELIYSGMKESSILWGKLLIGHFNRISKHSSYTGKLLLEDKGISLIQSHCHRGGAHYKRVYDRALVAYENFCLCDLNPNYMDRPNWQQGFSVVYKDAASDMFHVQQIPIVHSNKYRVIFEGEVFEA